MSQDENGGQNGFLKSLWEVVEKNPDTLKVPKNADQKQVDASLAEELNKLSLEERELTFEEIHGVVRELQETPELVERQLMALEDEIAAIDEKPAYNMALRLDRSYVESAKFRLMFLRAERFDAQQAATRLVYFLEKKRLLFGDDAIVRPLTLKDLTKEDIATMKAGVNQLLTARDRSGRLVIVDFSACGPQLYTSLMSHLRVYIYLVLSALEDDEETQKRGVVTVCWFYGPFRFNEKQDSDVVAEALLSLSWLPFRVTASHICAEDTPIKRLLTRVLALVGPPQTRKTLRFHLGAPTEVKYKLMSFGVPIDALPVTNDGKVKTTNPRKFIARQKVKELYIQQNRTPFPGIFLPTLRDVLLGKGKPFQQHQGNIHLRQLVESLLDEYVSASSKAKAQITWNVVYRIKRTGYFLKKDKDEWWIEATDQESRDKVGKLFVFQGRVQQARKENSERRSSTEPPAKRSRADHSPFTNMPSCPTVCVDNNGETEMLIWGRNMGPVSSVVSKQV